MQDDKLFELSEMQHFCFTVSALLPVLANFGDGTAFSVQTEPPALFLTEEVRVYDEEDVLRRETLSGVKLCLEVGRSVLYGGQPPDPKLKRWAQRRESFRPSVIFVRKKKNKTAMRSTSGKEGRLRGAEIEKMEREVGKEEVRVLSKELEIKNSK